MPSLYAHRYCLACGQPLEAVEWTTDVSGIGDEGPRWETFVDGDLCQCDTEDDDD